MKKQRAYSKYTVEAVLLLGQQIKLGRKKHKWSEQKTLLIGQVFQEQPYKRLKQGKCPHQSGLYSKWLLWSA